MSPLVADLVRLWTIQPLSVWEQLQARKRLLVDRRHVENLHHGYEWLRTRLVSRLPGHSGGYPWWAYCSRPDLRKARHQKPVGEQHFLIELALPRDRVLSFPFWAWDLIFYGRFLSRQEEASEDWHRRFALAVPDHEEVSAIPRPWLTELEASWELLFDPTLPDRGWNDSGASHSEREAVFEVLEMTQVVRVTPFQGSSRSRSPRVGCFQ